MRKQTSAIFISFDAVAVSGITVEASKIARQLAAKGIRCYLDLGYDIKVDKGRFGQPYDAEREIYDGVFTLVRIADIASIPDYNVGFIDYAHQVLIGGTVPAAPAEQQAILLAIERAAGRLTERLLQQWERLGIGYVFVENGTLPENIIYTKALYLAIATYGKRHAKGNFVIWRDHDLMWNSEQTATKYGLPPYRHAVKPVRSPYITYVTLNHHLKHKLEEWCDNGVVVTVKKNTYDFSKGQRRRDMRKTLGIREQDVLVARTTRIIPQKRLDRDIALVHRLNALYRRDGVDRNVYLVVAGDPGEHPGCYDGLRALADALGVQPFVKFVGALQHSFMPGQEHVDTIEDLYHSCDLVSFLTAWDYDSYGNPIGEAISAERCYITSSYEFYWEVYGRYGFAAPVMRTSAEQDGLPDDGFVSEVHKLLGDRAAMREIAQKNYRIGRSVLADNVVNILDLHAEPVEREAAQPRRHFPAFPGPLLQPRNN
ncbi:hypothetical protein IP92_04081 [Pseudoduganella flava]|uniref:Glycosyltransferase n=1 Tax=Pseudoduganella flava TaxID=871742 RepID=A0A562PLI8_9BURK|nr:hypothetical protein [Pseudoduganella flava]TWI44906.1 hypothetical protein IP92_04081 [Pseudoduganella flava]